MVNLSNTIFLNKGWGYITQGVPKVLALLRTNAVLAGATVWAVTPDQDLCTDGQSNACYCPQLSHQNESPYHWGWAADSKAASVSLV